VQQEGYNSQQITMLHFYRDLIVRTLWALPSLVSSNWLAVIFSIFVFLGLFLYQVRQQSGFKNLKTVKDKVKAVGQHWKENAWDGVKVSLFAWIILFGWGLITTVYQDHDEQARTNERLAEENKTLEIDSARKEKTIADLGKQIATPSPNKNGERTNFIGSRLADFLDQGSIIQKRWLATNDDKIIVDGEAKWLQDVQTFLEKNLGKPAATQFRYTRGNPLMGSPAGYSMEGGGHWQDIEGKKEFLSSLITQLRTGH
jgi:hypothetical protein